MCNWQQPAVAPSGSAPWMFPGFGEIAHEFFRLFAVLSLNLSPIWLCLSPWLGCCVRLACLRSCLPICLPSGFVSPFVSHLALSFTLAGVLCPSRWACLRSCLPICLPSGFVFHLGWDAVSASLACLRSRLPACFPSGLGCSVRLPGLVSLLSLVLSPSFWDAVSAPTICRDLRRPTIL